MPRRVMVLLVEDTASHARVAQRALGDGSDRHEVTTTDTLAGALAHLASGGFDLVLLDMNLPDSMGLDTVREVVAAAPKLPVVVLTTCDGETGELAVAEGAQDYVSKAELAHVDLPRVLRYALQRQDVINRNRELAAELERSNRELREAQRQSEATSLRLALAVEAAGAGVWEWNLASGRFATNERFHAMLGETHADGDAAAEDDLVARIHPEDVDRVWDSVRAACEPDGAPSNVQYRVRCADGSYKWVRAAGRVVERAPDGAAVRMIGLIVDVDAQLKGQRREQEAYVRLSRVTSCIPGAVFELRRRGDNDHAFAYASEGFRGVMGISPRWIREDDRSFWARVREEDAPGLRDAMARSAATLAPWRHEFRLAGPDTPERWLLLDAVAERDPDGDLVWYGSISDISEQKQLQSTLTAAMEAAEASNQAKSAFLANMSHEIRTPMTAVFGFIDLLDDPDITKDSARWRDALRTIRRSGQHLLTLINDILDLSKIESGQMTVESVRTSPVEITQQVGSMLAQRCEARGLRLETEFLTDLPRTVRTDPVRLRQILMNLVGNAIKFTESGGVAVRVSLEPDETPGRRLRFDVADTGIGMTAEQCERVFDPFTQADGSMTRRFGGTGLGLSICRSLAEMLGGGITLQSRPGEGTVATMRIDPGPLEAVEMITPSGAGVIGRLQGVADKAASAEPLPSLDGVRVLVAEDGPDNRRLIGFLLGKAGATVEAVEDGQAAIERLGEDPDRADVDLVLMDMQMPRLDGYAAAAKLRIWGHTLPIIALTAYAMGGDRERCLRAGCDDYMTKPIDRAQLIRGVARWANGGDADRVRAA